MVLLWVSPPLNAYVLFCRFFLISPGVGSNSVFWCCCVFLTLRKTLITANQIKTSSSPACMHAHYPTVHEPFIKIMATPLFCSRLDYRTLHGWKWGFFRVSGEFVIHWNLPLANGKAFWTLTCPVQSAFHFLKCPISLSSFFFSLWHRAGISWASQDGKLLNKILPMLYIG